MGGERRSGALVLLPVAGDDDHHALADVVVVDSVFQRDLTGRHLHRGGGRGQVVEDEHTVGVVTADVLDHGLRRVERRVPIAVRQPAEVLGQGGREVPHLADRLVRLAAGRHVVRHATGQGTGRGGLPDAGRAQQGHGLGDAVVVDGVLPELEQDVDGGLEVLGEVHEIQAPTDDQLLEWVLMSRGKVSPGRATAQSSRCRLSKYSAPAPSLRWVNCCLYQSSDRSAPSTLALMST